MIDLQASMNKYGRAGSRAGLRGAGGILPALNSEKDPSVDGISFSFAFNSEKYSGRGGVVGGRIALHGGAHVGSLSSDVVNRARLLESGVVGAPTL